MSETPQFGINEANQPQFTPQNGIPFYDLEGTIGFLGSTLVATNGRPVAEANADPNLLRRILAEEKIPLLHRPSQQSGSRVGYMENGGAYEDLLPRVPILMANMGWVRERLLETDPTIDLTHPTVESFEKLGVVLRGVSSYVINRAVNPHELVPVDIADLVRVTPGIHDIGFNMLLDERFPNNTIITPENAYQYAEDHDLFVNENRSCPAPEQMIKGVLAYVLGQSRRTISVEPTLPKYTIDFPQLVAFSYLTDDVTNAYNDAANALFRIDYFLQTGQIRQSKEATTRQILDIIEAYRKRLTDLQTKINNALDRNQNVPDVTQELVFQNEPMLRQLTESALENSL